jgi:hypothetical protein
MRDGALPTLYLGLRYLKSKDGKLSVLWVVVGACPDQCNGSLSIPRFPLPNSFPPSPYFPRLRVLQLHPPSTQP